MTFDGQFAQGAWIGLLADNTTVLNIVVGVVTVATVSLTGSSGSVAPVVAALQSLDFVKGDGVAIQYDSGTQPGKGTLSLGVQKL